MHCSFIYFVVVHFSITLRSLFVVHFAFAFRSLRRRSLLDATRVIHQEMLLSCDAEDPGCLNSSNLLGAYVCSRGMRL